MMKDFIRLTATVAVIAFVISTAGLNQLELYFIMALCILYIAGRAANDYLEMKKFDQELEDETNREGR